MKIIFTTSVLYSSDIFYRNLLNNYISTFRKLNFECKYLEINELKYISTKDILFVFALNAGRTVDFKSSIPWVSWYHDIHFKTLENHFSNFNKNDLIYFIGEPSLFGIHKKSLPTRSSVLLPSCTIDNINSSPCKPSSKTIDVLLIGYLPPNHQKNNSIPNNILDEDEVNKRFHKENKIKHLFNSAGIIGRHPYLRNLMLKVVTDNYTALSGSLNTNKILADLCTIIDKYFGGSAIREYYGSERLHLDYYATHFPRRIDRIRLAELALESGPNISFQIIGKGWEDEHRFIDYYKGFINPKFIHKELSTSKIILCNNTHGLSFNNRAIDAIMNDCIVFNHTTPHAGKTGTLEDFLKPEIDFIQYREDNLIAKIKSLLKDNSKMHSITKSAKSKLLKSHTTLHRSKQILKDLNLSV